jgi:hypothetical protein
MRKKHQQKCKIETLRGGVGLGGASRNGPGLLAGEEPARRHPPSDDSVMTPRDTILVVVGHLLSFVPQSFLPKDLG